jgi:selenocysteine-specific elongation factor
VERFKTLCTAGHIDHGKSALLEALTGKNPDVRPEEIERGITLDLGFTFLPVDVGEEVVIIDVPGHEDLLRTMIAGASGIDFFLLTVSADEGIMPQTIEHIQVLKFLGIKEGICVITKIDLADNEMIELVNLEISEYLEREGFNNIPLVNTSVVSGEGIDELKETIEELVSSHRGRERELQENFYMPIDRIFTLKGIGTIVAGTVASGKYTLGDEIELLPDKLELRVRNIQFHNRNVEYVIPGQRASFNLPGTDTSDIERGYALASPDSYFKTNIGDIFLEVSSQYRERFLKHNDRVRFLTDTSQIYGRVSLLEGDLLEAGSSGLAQIILEEPGILRTGNPFVLMHFTTLRIIGGGRILDPHPSHHRRRKDWVLNAIKTIKEDGKKGLIEVILKGTTGPDKFWGFQELKRRTQLRESSLKDILDELKEEGVVIFSGSDRFIHTEVANNLVMKVKRTLKRYFKENPLSKGMDINALSDEVGFKKTDLEDLLSDDLKTGEIIIEKNLIYPGEKEAKLTKKQEEILNTILDYLRFDSEGGNFDMISEGDILEKLDLYEDAEVIEMLKYLESEARIKRLFGNLFIRCDALNFALDETIKILKREGSLRVKDYKDMIGVSRRQATAILDHFSDEGFTVRIKGTHYLPEDAPEE